MATLAWATACSSDAEQGFDSHEVDFLIERTVPQGAASTLVTAARRSGWCIEASWEIVTDLGWGPYVAWLRMRRYTGLPDGERARLFRRTAPGDSYTLRIEQVSAGPPLRVGAQFLGCPD